ncbi:MAG: hypothetical protein PHI50_02150 [Alphaproteobacteria bacterium]|nr:hypothetical protein [Alphaproteobacteria bacterium]
MATCPLVNKIKIENFEHAECIGIRWVIDNENIDDIAFIISEIIIGQIKHAREIINNTATNPSEEENYIIDAAIDTLRTQKIDHRDGFLFEAISWIFHISVNSPQSFIKPPHLDATDHGVDGLIVSLDEPEKSITIIKISESKCTDNARNLFRSNVIPKFKDYHTSGKRNMELRSALAEFLSDKDTKLIKDVTDLSKRSYFVATTINNTQNLNKLFEGYSEIKDKHNEGAVFCPDKDLRSWFQELAEKCIVHLNKKKII